ncbi:MAG: hypothetical protein AB7P02_08345 [Alphaproteobacteria bacterium]
MTSLSKALGLAAGLAVAAACNGAMAQAAIDNSALERAEFREHKATWGLVYRLPQDVTMVMDALVTGQLRADLETLGLKAETAVSNIPHVTVVHIHNADPATPERMLKALTKRPAPVPVTLKTFYTTEAAKDAGHPWWLDLGIVKEGEGFETLMSYNTVATAALTPLRDGPLPRCTGPVFAKMSDAAKDLVRTTGVSGVNVMRDGKELRSHNPHNTLVYSMTRFEAPLQAAMKKVADQFNAALPDGLATVFEDVSIVEIGFAGNVLREIYRISLKDGSAVEVASGKVVATIPN